MSEEMQQGMAYALAILIVLTAFVLFGWWAFSWSTHTLVWLSFMGLSFNTGSRYKR